MYIEPSHKQGILTKKIIIVGVVVGCINGVVRLIEIKLRNAIYQIFFTKRHYLSIKIILLTIINGFLI